MASIYESFSIQKVSMKGPLTLKSDICVLELYNDDQARL